MKLRLHWPTIIISAIWIAGCLKSFILPYLKFHLFPGSWAWLAVPKWVTRSGDPAVFLFGFLTAIGFIVFLARGKRLVERKESGPLTFLGLLILIGGLYAFVADGLGKGWVETLYNASETPFWAVSLGLAMAFYKLEEAQSLLLFFVPMGLYFLLPVNVSLIEHFLPDIIEASLLKRLPHYTFPKAFKDPWFWSDSFVDYFILPYFLGWALLKKEEQPRKRYLVDRFFVGARKFLIALFISLGIAGTVVVMGMFVWPKLRPFFTVDNGGGGTHNGSTNNGKNGSDKKDTNGENGNKSNNGNTGNGQSNGTTVQPRGGCAPGQCWSNGYCCPNIAKYYCKGGCYVTMSQAMSVGGAQCATYKIICD